MKWIVMLLILIACAGCSVTVSGNADWWQGDSSEAEMQALQQKHQQLLTVVSSMTKELKAAPADLDSVDNVLRKYGIER